MGSSGEERVYPDPNWARTSFFAASGSSWTAELVSSRDLPPDWPKKAIGEINRIQTEAKRQLRRICLLYPSGVLADTLFARRYRQRQQISYRELIAPADCQPGSTSARNRAGKPSPALRP